MNKDIDVFISHSSEDAQVANAICFEFESHRIRCWIAPRNIGTGEEWEESIVKAIDRSKIFVIVYSGNSEKSKFVKRELRMALNKCDLIIPFRIEDIPLKGVMDFYLSDRHWMDAIDEPRESQIKELALQVLEKLPDRKKEYLELEREREEKALQKAKEEAARQKAEEEARIKAEEEATR
jgi:hypothetical protein